MKQLFKIGLGIKIYSVINCLFLIFYGMCTDYVVIVSKRIYQKALNPLTEKCIAVIRTFFYFLAMPWLTLAIFIPYCSKWKKQCHQKCNCEVKKKMSHVFWNIYNAFLENLKGKLSKILFFLISFFSLTFHFLIAEPLSLSFFYDLQ